METLRPLNFVSALAVRYSVAMPTLIRFARIALVLGVLLSVAIGVPLKVLDTNGLKRVEHLNKELQTLRDTNHQLRRENAALSAEIKAFHADPEYIEKIARDELGMVGPRDIVYQFSE
ncbi:MAG: septum formation initiator family protein [Myxococcota bacterium]|nr:septum formation initiator family protein [Myxococcota bacterium]